MCVDYQQGGNCFVAATQHGDVNSRYYNFQYECDTKKTGCEGLSNLTGAQSWTGGNGQACSGGCAYEPVVQAGGTTIDGKSYWVTDSSGLKPTGQACGADEISESKAPGDCEPVPGQTLCVKKDGSLCATASNGKKLCWQPRETGTKTTGDTVGIKQAGSAHSAPNLQLPSGDVLVKDQDTKGVSTTIQSGGQSTTVTSNVTTYKTQNGTDAGSGDQSDEADEDKNGNSASGGGDCKTPPVVTGDQALGMVATQAWATRCAVEAGNSTKVTGDIGDCKSAFTVEGDNAQAHQLRAMRAERCGDGPEWGKAKDGEGSTADPHEGAEGKDGPGTWSLKVGTDMLDTSGFLGGSCPTLGTIDLGRFGQFSFDSVSWWCPLIAAMRGVMLLIGAFIAIRLLLGE